jgi:hypothetical protein
MMDYRNPTPEEISIYAYRVETGTYRRHLTEEEITQLRAELSDTVIDIRRQESELREISQSYRERIKLLKQTLNRKIDSVEHAYETITGELTLVDDQDAGMMHYYNEEGLLVDSRRLRADERQTRLYPITSKESV